MIYFDNAATGGRKPDIVQTAVASSVKVCANAGRSGHKLAVSCATLVQKCRETLSEFFDGYGYERVIFTKNCTEALNIALFGVLKRGDHVVTTPMEHNSVLRPLQKLKTAGIIEYDVCPLNTNGNVNSEAIAKLLRPNTRLVAVTSASNVTGATPPLMKIRTALPKKTLFLVDGAQAGGHFPLSMQKTGIDILSLAGHKGLMGIQGSGALLFSDRVTPTPFLYGGTGSLSVSLDMPNFYPDALEAGTISFPAVLSLLEGVRYLQPRIHEIADRLFALTAYCAERIRAIPDYELFSQPNACGILSFRHKTLQSEAIADALSERFNIAVRGGLHCAPLMHEALGTAEGGLIRASFSHFNSETEINELLFALNVLRN